jgi:predicted porin
MNKKLLAVAVAGALAAPGVAFAQAWVMTQELPAASPSSVTIDGLFKVGLENLNYGNALATRLNSSQMRVVDNSSQIHFKSVEDLGNGLFAVARLDVRFAPPNASGVQTSNPIGSGNSYVGLASRTWGMLTTGRWDLHYGISGVDMIAKAGALEAWNVSLMDYIGASPIANTTRTPNVVKWDSPNWNGFNGTVAWSASPFSDGGDMTNVASSAGAQTLTAGAVPGSVAVGAAGAGLPSLTTTTRKGDAWNINPRYFNGPFDIAYSYWRAKSDAPGAATNDQRGDTVAGNYKFGGFKIGLAWNKSSLNNANTGALAAQRNAWSVPMSYVWGPNNIIAHYTRAGNSSNAGGTVNDSGAKMYAVAYVYDLSKRTSLGVTYAQIKNDANINYNFFTSSSLGTTDAGGAQTGAGENPRLIQMTIAHYF